MFHHLHQSELEDKNAWRSAIQTFSLVAHYHYQIVDDWCFESSYKGTISKNSVGMKVNKNSIYIYTLSYLWASITSQKSEFRKDLETFRLSDIVGRVTCVIKTIERVCTIYFLCICQDTFLLVVFCCLTKRWNGKRIWQFLLLHL